MKEYKVYELKKEKNYENVEAFLQEKSVEGWQLVSMSSDISKDIRGMLLLVMEREKQASMLMCGVVSGFRGTI